MYGITPEKRCLSVASLVFLIEFDRIDRLKRHIFFHVHFTTKLISHNGFIVKRRKSTASSGDRRGATFCLGNEQCRFSKISSYFFSHQAHQEVMSIKIYNTLGVLCSLCRRHYFVSGEIQDYLLEMGLEGRANSSQAPAIRAAPSMYLPDARKYFQSSITAGD